MIYNVKNEGIMKNFLKKPVSKAFIGAVLTIAIGVITSLLGNWDTTQKFFVIKVLTFIVLALLYIITTIIYTVIDLNQRQSYEILKHQVDTFEDLVISIISIAKTHHQMLTNAYMWLMKNILLIPIYGITKKLVELLANKFIIIFAGYLIAKNMGLHILN